MNIIDIFIIILLLIAFFSGLKKGLFVAMASLIGIIAGVYCAIYFSGYAAGYLSRWFNWSEYATSLTAFAITFLGVVFIVSLAGSFLTKVADFAMLGFINKLLGAIFNVASWAFILSVFFMFLNIPGSGSALISEERKEGSALYYPIASVAPLVLPRLLEKAEDLHRTEASEATETDSEEK